MIIKFITSHKTTNLIINNENSLLIDIIKENGIPFGSISIYQENKGDLVLYTGLYKSINDISENTDKLILLADRNIDYHSIINKSINVEKIIEATTEFTFDSLEEDSSKEHLELSSQDCIYYIKKRVFNFLKEDAKYKANTKIVVGVSGGGDSNALLKGLIDSNLVKPKNIIPVMIMGIPDWDKGIGRAKELCRKFGLELRIVEKEEINNLLNKKENSDWASDYEKLYSNCDLEIIGTLAIRLALSKVAKDEGTNIIVTGLNQEDIIAECFYFTMRGELPLQFPVRNIDGINIWYPLYRCPKKIIDGCFPKLSLQNYQARYPSNMFWRATSYYFAQSVHTILPGLENYFLEGFKEISNKNIRKFNYDERIGFSTVNPINDKSIEKWKNFIKS